MTGGMESESSVSRVSWSGEWRGHIRVIVEGEEADDSVSVDGDKTKGRGYEPRTQHFLPLFRKEHCNQLKLWPREAIKIEKKA